jgi:hypothetical protein
VLIAHCRDQAKAFTGSTLYKLIKGETLNMKKTFVYGAMLCAVMIAVAAASAATNFAGTWLVDKTKSEGLNPRMMEGGDIIWTVTQDDKTITVESPGRGGTQKTVYKLDGSETTTQTEGQMPGKLTTKAKWMDNGKVLELSSVRNANFQGNDVTITTTQHWELSEDGKMLKIHSKSETPQGARETKYVFTKK